MLVAGIDPDTTHSGFAIYESVEGKVLYVGTVSAQGATSQPVMPRIVAMSLSNEMHEAVRRFGHVDCVAIEHMHHRGSDLRPDDIINLAVAEGVLLEIAQITLARRTTVFRHPRPRDWKGSVPKRVSQRRILEDANLDDTLACLESHDPVPGSVGMSARRRLQVVDAIGIAMWAARARP